MAYIKRDPDGKIVALVASPGESARERLSANNPEVLEFLFGNDAGEATRQFLSATDNELVRVVEDLIELLVEKNLLLFTELPPAAQQKLINRKQARETLPGDESPMVDREDIL